MKFYFDIIWAIAIITLTASLVASQNCSSGGLSSGTNKLTSKVDNSRKRHGTIGSIEKVKVKWEINPNERDQIAQKHDVSKKRLQIKQEDGNWEYFYPKRQVTYTGAYTWTVPRIPCLSYGYRLIVPSKGGDTSENCFETDIATLPAESIERIRESKFVPSKVENINITADDSSLSLTWDKSLCAEEYHVYVLTDNEDLDDRKEQYKKIANTGLAEAKFDGLQSCTNYLAEVIPAVEGNEDEKNMITESFHTKPDSRSAEKLDLNDLSTTKNSVSLTFYNYMQSVNCLSKFDIQVCQRWDENEPAFCLEPKTVEMNANYVQYSKDNLNSCSNYTMVVTPKYDGISINPKTIAFTTKFEDKESYETNVEAGVDDVKVKVYNIDCFTSYKISYRLMDQTLMSETKNESGVEGKWKYQTGSLDSNEIILENLTPSSRYQIKMEVYRNENNHMALVLGETDFETLKQKTLGK